MNVQHVQPELVKQWLQLTLLNPLSPSGVGTATGDGGSVDFSMLLQEIIAMLPGSGMMALERGGSAPVEFGPFGLLAGTDGYGVGPMRGAADAVRTVRDGQAGVAAASASGHMAGLYKAASQTAWRYQTESYDRLIAEASSRYGVESSLVKAVIQVESAYNPQAVSRAGAKGLMQLMDATAEWLGVTDPFDPRQNIHGGTRFLSQLLDRYDGQEAVALAAYNAGPGRIDRLGIRSNEELEQRLHELPRETQAYVRKVLDLKPYYE